MTQTAKSRGQAGKDTAARQRAIQAKVDKDAGNDSKANDEAPQTGAPAAAQSQMAADQVFKNVTALRGIPVD